MQWSAGELLVLADQGCASCLGLGARVGRGDQRTPCHCVYRAVFRACLARFKACDAKEKYVAVVSLESNPGRLNKSTWGLKNEEYMADFVIIARRVLAPDSLQYWIFKFHHLLGADWKLCCWRLRRLKIKLNRGEFYHEVYRLQSKLGRAFGSIEPHALFPTDQYFASSAGREVVREPFPVVAQPLARPLRQGRRFPLKAQAAT